MTALLELDRVSKAFGTVVVADDLSYSLEAVGLAAWDAAGRLVLARGHTDAHRAGNAVPSRVPSRRGYNFSARES